MRGTGTPAEARAASLNASRRWASGVQWLLSSSATTSTSPRESARGSTKSQCVPGPGARAGYLSNGLPNAAGRRAWGGAGAPCGF